MLVYANKITVLEILAKNADDYGASITNILSLIYEFTDVKLSISEISDNNEYLKAMQRLIVDKFPHYVPLSEALQNNSVLWQELIRDWNHRVLGISFECYPTPENGYSFYNPDYF